MSDKFKMPHIQWVEQNAEGFEKTAARTNLEKDTVTFKKNPEMSVNYLKFLAAHEIGHVATLKWMNMKPNVSHKQSEQLADAIAVRLFKVFMPEFQSWDKLNDLIEEHNTFVNEKFPHAFGYTEEQLEKEVNAVFSDNKRVTAMWQFVLEAASTLDVEEKEETMTPLQYTINIIRRIFGWMDRMVSEKSFEKTRHSVYYKIDKSGNPIGFATRKTGEETRIESLDKTMAWQQGLRPEVLKIVLPKKYISALAFEHLTGLLVKNVCFYDDNGKLKVVDEYKQTFRAFEKPNGDIIFKLKMDRGTFSIYRKSEVVNHMVTNALATIGRTEDNLLPEHPNMFEAADKNDICLLVNKPKTPTWAEFLVSKGMDPKDKNILLRAGKDIYGRAIDGTFHLMNVLVIDGDGKSHDGNMFFRKWAEHLPTEFLVRAYTEAKEFAYHILKARGIIEKDGKLYHPFNNEEITYSGDKYIHGVTTTDNIKWSKEIKAGDVIPYVLIVSKNEESEDKSAYAINALSIIMGKWASDSRILLEEMFSKRAKLVGKLLESAGDKLLAEIEETIDDESGFQLSELLAKYKVGTITADESKELFNYIVRKIKSVRLKDSIFPSVIFATHWKGREIRRGEFLIGDEAFQRITDKGFYPFDLVCTLCRYPITSDQSFFRAMCVGMAYNLSGNIIVMNPDDAKYLQGDGDDHLAMYLGIISKFSYVNAPDGASISREVEMDPDDSVINILFKGAVAQKSIGSAFNNMLKVLAAFKDYDMDQAPVYAHFGGYLDLFAQGIKKNYRLPSLESIRFEADMWIEGIKDKACVDPTHEGYYQKFARLYLTSWETDGDPSGECANLLKELFDVDTKPVIMEPKDTTKFLANDNNDFLNAVTKFALDRHSYTKWGNNPVYWHNNLVKEINNLYGGKIAANAKDLILNPDSPEPVLIASVEMLKSWHRCYVHAAAQLHNYILTLDPDAHEMEGEFRFNPYNFYAKRLECMNGMKLMMGLYSWDRFPAPPTPEGDEPKGEVEKLQEIEVAVKVSEPVTPAPVAQPVEQTNVAPKKCQIDFTGWYSANGQWNQADSQHKATTFTGPENREITNVNSRNVTYVDRKGVKTVFTKHPTHNYYQGEASGMKCHIMIQFTQAKLIWFPKQAPVEASN